MLGKVNLKPKKTIKFIPNTIIDAGNIVCILPKSHAPAVGSILLSIYLLCTNTNISAGKAISSGNSLANLVILSLY